MSRSIDRYVSLQGGFAIKSSDYRSSGIPLIRISNVTSKGLDKTNVIFVPKEFAFELKDYLANKDDTLIAMSGATTGKCCLVKKDDLPCLINQRVGRFVVTNEREVDKKFVYYIISSHAFQNELLKDAVGGAQPNVSPKQIEKINWDFPSYKQQRKISEILSLQDSVIEKTQTLIEKYKAIKQGLLNDLFTRGIDIKIGKLRPKQQDVPEMYKESKLGWIPKEWNEGKFIDFADKNIHHSFTGGPFGSDLQTKHYTNTGVRIIQLQNIGDGVFNDGYKIYTSEERANYLINCNIFHGEIIISKMADPIARACIIPNTEKRYLMASDGIRLSIDKKRFNSRFVMETINHYRFRNIAELKATGSTRARIGLTELREIVVTYPNKYEQDAIGLRLDTIENKLKREQEYLLKLQQIKFGLMTDLLSGKKLFKIPTEKEIYTT
ncbi:MAG: restriction endonuclease subunit S [Chitinophagaceae bacterium]|nr:restriction endonuclease subunit S [Chitinophagaceae bacterium]